MSSEVKQLAQQLRTQGSSQFAEWNAGLFDGYVAGPVERLESSLEWQDRDQETDTTSVPNFLRLVFEGIGAGWVRSQDRGDSHTFLEHCLKFLVPNQLGSVPRAQRTEVLRQVWNLGEGLAREPQWLNQFVITQTGWSTELASLEKQLVTLLSPVLSPLTPAKWNGKYQLNIINLRDNWATVLPGKLYLASPSVLCVENRTSQGTIAIFLQKRGKSQILGSVPRLPAYEESFDAPKVQANADSISINNQEVSAKFLNTPSQTLVVEAGYVVVSAEDSQRIWLVEAA